MFNLSDIYAKALNGQAAEEMARHFGLSLEKTRAAVDALLPAFSTGLNRTARDAPKVADLFGMFTMNTPFAAAFDTSRHAFGPDSLDAGAQALRKIFGSDLAARNVADKAAAATGLQADVLQRLMPALSAMLMGGIYKDGLAGNNPLVAMMAQLSTAGLMPQSWLNANPFADLFPKVADMLANNASAKGFAASAPMAGMEQIAAIARQAMAVSPLLELNPFLKAAAEAAHPAGSGQGGKPSSNVTLGQQAADAWSRTFGELFTAGQKASDDYLARIESLFNGK